ncbi:type II toxin-antitoxin system VapC family toxin [Patescibacteria group bacterium]|nr:type II toxin-antitoxin system VapC family toxin [Patescibacteria group bacterium]
MESDFIINLLDGEVNAVQFYEGVKNSLLAITAVTSVTLFEILRGREQNQSKIQKFDELRRKLEVLPFGEKEAEEASRIEIALHQRGFTIEPDDLFIGATAKTNEAILVSNDSDYNRIDGLQLKNY